MRARAMPAARRELGALLALLVLALLLRLPHLHTIPRYTDETGEVATALAIAFEGERPLVHNDAYRGPVWAYALALPLALLGPTPGLPRAFALTIGLATVLAVYLLARLLAGHRAGLAAGFLQATAFAPIALESHVAWSNHATPLAVTLAAIATWLGAAERRAPAAEPASVKREAAASPRGLVSARHDPRDRWLLVAGLLWGLALQTHPSVIAPMAGAALWLLATPTRRARLRRPAPWLALALLAFALSPILVHNLQRYLDDGGLASLDEATAESQPVNRDLGLASLSRNYAGLAGQLGRAAGAGRPFEPGEPVQGPLLVVTDALRPLLAWLYAALLLTALVRAARQGPRLPACMALAGMAILPLVNRNYQSFYDMRYLGFLLPLAYVTLAAWLLDPGRAEPAPRFEPRRGLAPGGRIPRPPGSERAAQLLLAGLAGYSLLALGAHYQRETLAGRTNAAMIAVTEVLEREREALVPGLPEQPPAAQIWIDKAMRPIKLEGGGDPVRAFDQLLALRELPAEPTDLDELRWFLQNDDRTRYWILAADATAAALAGEGFAVETVHDAGAGWRLLRREP